MVQAAIPGAELLLATVGIVAIASEIIHGASASPISAWYRRKAAEETLIEERESTALGLFRPHDGQVSRLAPENLQQMLESEAPPIILDVRSRSTYDHDRAEIPGSVRVLPDEVVDWANDESFPDLKNALIEAYCT